MTERGLLPDFSPAALAQTEALGERVVETGPAIRDLRDLAWVSIDNDDTRDLDQLSVAEPLAGGAVKLLVAVADVDATVAEGSAIDGHARANTTSVYTAAEIFPMLPERLSTDLTSLGEARDRLAIVVEMTVGPDGAVTASDVYRALVRNQAKLAYDSVAAWLDGTGKAPAAVAAQPAIADQLRLQARVAQAMKDLRHHRGALTLETTEARAVFDGDAAGRPAAGREEPGQGAHRGLHDRGERRDRAVPRAPRLPLAEAGPAHPRAVGPHRRAGRRPRRAAARGAERSRAPGVPRAPAPGRSGAVRRRVALRREAAGLG